MLRDSAVVGPEAATTPSKAKGDDGVHGGTGVDTLLGGGFDRLYARESPALADNELNCGAEGGVVETRDSQDPAALGC